MQSPSTFVKWSRQFFVDSTRAQAATGKGMVRIFQKLCAVFLLLALLSVAKTAQCQERMTIQGNARGTSTQLGRLVPVKIIIEKLSTDEDQKALIDAFKRSGHNGVLDALERMSPKGRVSLEGRVGNDVKYIKELPAKNGRRFRLVTDRNLTFGELRNNTRSAEYSIGAVEVTITPDGKGSGTILPACKLKVTKQQQIEIETYQNPWQLTDMIVSMGD